MALTPGTRLGVYNITASIGVGGMGQVFRARDTNLDRDVAIKVLPEAFAHDADGLAVYHRTRPKPTVRWSDRLFRVDPQASLARLEVGLGDRPTLPRSSPGIEWRPRRRLNIGSNSTFGKTPSRQRRLDCETIQT